MELPAVAMVLTTVYLASVAARDDRSSGAAAQQQKWARSRTSWCCDHAPRGWQLLQLFLPWITLLFLCMACLSVTGESTATMEEAGLQSSFCLSEGSIKVHDQATMPTSCALTEGSKDVFIHKPATSKERVEVTPLGNGDFDLLSSFSADMFDSSIQEDLLPALCILPGLTHMQPAFLSTGFQIKSSAEIILQACLSQEQSVAAILDWGSHSLSSVSFKVLTLKNRQSNTEVRVSRIFTSNMQFCTVDFQEVVLSPGRDLSILIAYIPNSIGKAEGRLILQTSTGGYSVKTLGEGVSSPLKIHLRSSVLVPKPERPETISLFNPFDEPVSVEEAFLWVEPRLKASTFYQIRGEGLLCRRIGILPDCFYSNRLKVRPVANWVVAPYSSSPIMELSIVVDDGKHLVGTLCLKLYRHSVQLSEILVVPLEMEWLTMVMPRSRPFENSPFEAKGLEQKSGGPVVGKAVHSQGQATEVFVRSQSINMHTTTRLETLKLEYGVSKEIGCILWIGSSCKPLFTSRLCHVLQAFVPSRLIIRIDSSLYRAVLVPCSPILGLVASLGTDDVGSDTCLAEHIQCTKESAEDRLSYKYFNMLHAPFKVSAMAKGFADASNDCMHVPQHYPYVGVLKTVAGWSNGSDSGWSTGSPVVITCLALFAPEYLTELNTQGYEFNLLGLYVFCDCPNFATESSAHYQLACNRYDSIASTVPEAWPENDSKPGKRPIKGYDVAKGNTHSFTIQESCFMESQELAHATHMQKDTMQVGLCGSDYAGPFCDHGEAKALNALEFERALAEGCYEAHNVPIEVLSTDRSQPVCSAALFLSRHQKLILKVGLLILFSVLIVLVKLLKQERLVMTDVRLRHYCNHTFFLHSVCLKTSYIEGAEWSSSFKHALERLNNTNSMEFPGDPCYENRFLNVLARGARSLGSILRWVFDSQETILNVRVQIAESPCAATGNQVSNFSSNSCLADSQASTPVQATRCVGCIDASSVKHFESNTSPVGLSSTQCFDADVLQSPASTNSIVDAEQTHQVKEKKEKGRRKKKRSNISDLKQESDRMCQSGSSSPPSSPASPATPLAYSSISPFLRSDSPSKSFKGLSNSSRPRGNAFHNSSRTSATQFSGDSLSQLDMRGEHAHNNSRKKLSQVNNFGSKATLEPLSMRPTALLKMESSGKGFLSKDTSKETCTGENWAAVARRAIATSEELDQRPPELASSSSRCFMTCGAHVRPVLLPSATFPQRGRSMQWSPRMLENKNQVLSDPMSPSLVSMSQVAPDARAPGSRPATPRNGSSLVAATSQVEKTNIPSSGGAKDGSGNKEYLYDIWGDHFAEFSRTTQSNTFCRGSTLEVDSLGAILPALPRVESFFATSTAVAATSTSISRPSAGFSIFSRNAFFSPHQHEDTTGSFKT